MKPDYNISPPSWANRFLIWFLNDELAEEVQGDLEEQFHATREQSSLLKARLIYWYQVFNYLRPFAIRNFRSYHTTYLIMYKHYFKIGLRNFKKDSLYSMINLGGLSLGIFSCLLISLYVFQELGYDDFHPHAGENYRVVMDMYGNQELKTKSAVVYPAVGPGLKADFPEVQEYTRILPFGNGVYSRKSESGDLIRFNETRAVLADETFFTQFGFRLLKGDPKQVLSGKNQLVISQSTAKKYFGAEDPIGQTLNWIGQRELVITGVMEDFPSNSHMQFDLISSLSSLDGFDQLIENWGWYDFYTFIRLDASTDKADFSKKLSTYLDGKKANEYQKSRSREELWMQPLEDIHLHSAGLSWDMGQNGGALQVYFLSAIALLILIIAWINFINLSTARAIRRAKEVGIRKVVGAQKRQLLYQFLTEAFVYNCVGVLIALFLSALIIPLVNQYLGLHLNWQLLLSGKVLMVLGGMIVLGALLSGLYPAFVLSSFQPLSVLKGRNFQQRRTFGLRQLLVIFQFTTSIVLILGTFLVVKQLRFMQNYDLGLNIEQTLVLRAPTASNEHIDLQTRLGLFRNTLKEIPEVKGMTISSSVPGIENFGISGFTSKYFPEEYRDCYRVSIDEHFMHDFEINLLAGRDFSPEMRSDSSAVILNEQALKHLGFSTPEEALGEKVNPGNRREWNIIGVVENYHQASIKEDLDPVIFFYRPNGGSYYSLKLQSNNYSEALATLESQWDKIYPDNPFDYFFLDENFAQQYQAEERFNFIFIFFAILAVLVACLGFFGLVSYTAEQSQKEIGIRKVLGASVIQVILFLVRDYAKLLLIALVIAFPLAYYLMSKWLENFAYQTAIDLGIFLIGTLLIILVSFLTVSGKTYQAASKNPVNVLRSE